MNRSFQIGDKIYWITKDSQQPGVIEAQTPLNVTDDVCREKGFLRGWLIRLEESKQLMGVGPGEITKRDG